MLLDPAASQNFTYDDLGRLTGGAGKDAVRHEPHRSWACANEEFTGGARCNG
jgi:hypothetical protein